MRDEHDVLRKVAFFRVPQQHSEKCRIENVNGTHDECDKNEGHRREAKPIPLKQLIRFIARTPGCKQLFGEFGDSVQARNCPRAFEY